MGDACSSAFISTSSVDASLRSSSQGKHSDLGAQRQQSCVIQQPSLDSKQSTNTIETWSWVWRWELLYRFHISLFGVEDYPQCRNRDVSAACWCIVRRMTWLMIPYQKWKWFSWERWSCPKCINWAWVPSFSHLVYQLNHFYFADQNMWSSSILTNSILKVLFCKNGSCLMIFHHLKHIFQSITTAINWHKHAADLHQELFIILHYLLSHTRTSKSIYFPVFLLLLFSLHLVRSVFLTSRDKSSLTSVFWLSKHTLVLKKKKRAWEYLHIK